MLSRRLPGPGEPNAWSVALERRRASGAPILDLTDQNPTRVGLAVTALDDLAALADPGGLVYDPAPRGLHRARAAVSAYYASRDLTVDPEDIVLTASTSEAYAHLFRLLCDPGERVAVPVPSYPLFEPLASLQGVHLDPFRLRLDGRWRLDPESLEQAIGDLTRAVVIVQPNPPTGSCFTAEEVHAIEAMCEPRGVAVIADEVFGDHLWDAAGGTSSREPSLLAGPRSVPTFVLQGLSKLCGMPQLKLGWIALAGPEATRETGRWGLDWIGDTFLSIGTPVQLALPRLLERRHAFREAVLERVLTNRRTLEGIAARQGLEVPPSQGGWVSLLGLPRSEGADQFAVNLIDDGVVVHPGHFYDMDDDRHLVVSLIVDPHEFEEATRVIRQRASR
jgi:alanine-synthesizing transaminase